MSISLRSNPDGSGTLLNGSTPVMEITAAGVVSLPNIAAGSSANQPVNLGQFIGTNVSLSVNGYQKLPSGLIIQWGVLGDSSWTGNIERNVLFPIVFPNSVLRVFASSGDSGYVIASGARAINNSTIALVSASGGSHTSNWFAVGY